MTIKNTKSYNKDKLNSEICWSQDEWSEFQLNYFEVCKSFKGINLHNVGVSGFFSELKLISWFLVKSLQEQRSPYIIFNNISLTSSTEEVFYLYEYFLKSLISNQILYKGKYKFIYKIRVFLQSKTSNLFFQSGRCIFWKKLIGSCMKIFPQKYTDQSGNVRFTYNVSYDYRKVKYHENINCENLGFSNARTLEVYSMFLKALTLPIINKFSLEILQNHYKLKSFSFEQDYCAVHLRSGDKIDEVNNFPSLSSYEKMIRECGIKNVVICSDNYHIANKLKERMVGFNIEILSDKNRDGYEQRKFNALSKDEKNDKFNSLFCEFYAMLNSKKFVGWEETNVSRVIFIMRNFNNSFSVKLMEKLDKNNIYSNFEKYSEMYY